MNNEQLFDLLAQCTAVPSLPGFEEEGCDVVETIFRRYTNNIVRDGLGSVSAVMGGTGPTVFVAAHMDGLGLLVRSIESDGFLGIEQLGGFDVRTLPATEVCVHGRSGDYFGVIGAKPPHVLKSDDYGKVLQLDELFVDVGMGEQQVREVIEIGDLISLVSPLKHLQGEVVAGRALDNRAGIAVMVEAMRRLSKKPCEAQVVFCATAQEEESGLGAKTNAYRFDPDMAIAIDVTHAHTPGAPKIRTVAFDRPCISRGVVIDRRISDRLYETARSMGIDVDIEVDERSTGTDAESTIRTRGGIPSAVLSVPLRYMHTTVECITLKSVNACGKLLAEFLRGVDANWEEWECE